MNKLKQVQYNCRKATFLIEKRMLAKLTLIETVELRIHLAGCSVCRTYQVQSKLIGQMVHQLLSSTEKHFTLRQEDKDAMQKRIKDELKK